MMHRGRIFLVWVKCMRALGPRAYRDLIQMELIFWCQECQSVLNADGSQTSFFVALATFIFPLCTWRGTLRKVARLCRNDLHALWLSISFQDSPWSKCSCAVSPEQLVLILDIDLWKLFQGVATLHRPANNFGFKKNHCNNFRFRRGRPRYRLQ